MGLAWKFGCFVTDHQLLHRSTSHELLWFKAEKLRRRALRVGDGSLAGVR